MSPISKPRLTITVDAVGNITVTLPHPDSGIEVLIANNGEHWVSVQGMERSIVYTEQA